jgi:hypothetical protein
MAAIWQLVPVIPVAPHIRLVTLATAVRDIPGRPVPDLSLFAAKPFAPEPIRCAVRRRMTALPLTYSGAFFRKIVATAACDRGDT